MARFKVYFGKTGKILCWVHPDFALIKPTKVTYLIVLMQLKKNTFLFGIFRPEIGPKQPRPKRPDQKGVGPKQPGVRTGIGPKPPVTVSSLHHKVFNPSFKTWS